MGNLILPKYLSDEIRKRAAAAGQDEESYLQKLLKVEPVIKPNLPETEGGYPMVRNPVTGLLMIPANVTVPITDGLVNEMLQVED